MRVLRVDVEHLKGPEGRQQFAVVHVSEDCDLVVAVQSQGEGADFPERPVTAHLLGHWLVDPEPAVFLDSVLHHDDIFTVFIVVRLCSLTCN